MGNLMKKLKKTKMVKQFGILSLVLAMLIGVMSNGTIINAVDGNADANITFNSRIVEKVNGQDVDVSQADSGDSFFLAIYYAVSASTDASKYTECTLSITLPNDIEFDETTDISNTGFDSIEQRTSLGKNILSIKSKELAAGQSGTLYLKMHFKNMTTKNGTTAKFVDMKMTGSMVNENGSYTINPVSVPDASVTAKASQEWTVGKNVIQQADGNNYTIKSIDGKDYYSVDYKVTAAPGSNLTDLGNNYGRLNCTTFELVDTLPVAPAGREDGGAANISIKVGDKVLEEGADKDYELVLNENGTVKAIKIYYISTYESNPDDTNYVPDGAAMLTTYTINANYSKDAYRVLPNEKDDIPFILDNKVELKYLPLGENTPKYVSANAPVNVGWVDENAPTTNLDITKYVTVNGDNNIVGDNKFIFDQEKQDCYYQNTDSRIAFGLYTDEACQNAATDIDGNTVGNSKVIDKDGKVNFAKISEGTYYLKETVGNLPFIGDGVDSANGETIYKIEVKNENNKAVVYLDDKKIENGKLEINNLTTAQGFGYVAFNKVGTSATNSQHGPLAGVKFILTNKVTGDKYETVSNDKGLVLFEGIIAGDYTVEEDFSSAEYDKPDVYKWDVKVEANKVNYPSLMLQDHNTGVPYVVNSSNKGKLIINKVDALTETKKLNGAEFTVYGPFESKETANIAIESEDFSSVDSFTLNGNEESKALVKGFYVYQETKAPNHYKLDENYYVTELKTQTLNEVTVKNEELGYLQILKKGSLKDYPTITVNLAGAKFHVYTNKNATDDSLVKDDAGNPIVIESNNSVSSSSNSNKVELAAGTYYLKEFEAPSGYNQLTDVITVEIQSGKTATKEIMNESTTLGYLEVTKIDSKTKEPLANVTFDVYRKDDDTKVDTIKTDSDGKAKTKFLEAGEYYLKETSKLTGYAVNTKNIDFKIENNKETNKTVSNDPLVGYMIRKVSSLDHNTGLYKAEFKLLDADKKVIDEGIESNGQGYVIFTGLTPGATYYYVETKAPDGYTLNTTEYSFTAPQVNDTNNSLVYESKEIVENVPKGKFTITKTSFNIDETIAKPAGNITFEYFPKLSTNIDEDRKIADTNKTLLTVTTNNDGIATSKIVDAGEYWVVEKNVKSEFEVEGGNAKVVTVKPGSNTDDKLVSNVDVVNRLIKGKVAVKKVSSVDSDTGVAATFNVYKWNETGNYTGDPVYVLTTKADGNVVTSEFLAPGKYVLIEKAVVGNYTIDPTPHEFEIVEGKTNKVYVENPIENVPYSSLGLVKTAKWLDKDNKDVSEPLAGIKFSVYKAKEVSSDEDGAISKDDKWYVKDGNALATIESDVVEKTVSGLEPGFYIVEENLTAEQQNDYEQQPPKVVELEAGKTTHVTFENTPKKGKIKLTKTNEDKTVLLDGAEFKIYYVDSNGSQTITANDGKKYTVSDSGISTKIISGTAVLYDANGKSSKDPGVGYSVFLDPGKEVVLQEVRAPDYYGIIHEWWYVGEIKAQHISEIEVQNYLLTNPIGYKYDEAEKLLAGATMGLFSTETGADRLNKLSQTEIDEVIADSEKWAEYDLVSTAVSTDKYFKFENIDSTQTYYVTELKQPAGYNKNTDIRKVTVEVNGKVYFLKDADTNETVTFINYKYRQIWVSKVLKFAGEQSALTGINFKVYPVVESNESVADAFKIGDKWYIKTGEEVTYTTGTISSGKTGSFMTAPSPAGLYVVEEDITSLPEHVVAPDTTKYLVNLGFDTDNTDLYSDQADASNVIVNTSNYGKLALNKMSSTNSNTYIKATFNIYAKNDEAGHDYSKDTPISTITTNGNQNAVLTDYLKPGNYVLVESLISTDGYVLNPTPREFTIEADKVTGLDGSVYTTVSDAVKNPLVVTNVPKGSVELTKQGTYLDANGLTNPVALSGVNFNVYKSVKLADGTLDLSSTNLVGTAVSQSNGKLQFKVNGTDVTSKKWLEAGDYILQETTVGTTNKNNGFADYAYLGKFTITPGDITKEIVKVDENGNESGKADNVISNTSSYGKLEITKVDHYDKTKKLADVVFEVFNESGILVDTIKTNKNGVARTKLLPAGEYTLKEKSTNNDYFLNDTLYGPYTVEALKVTGTDGKIEITNMMKQSLKVIKKDSHTGKEIDKLDGTTFSLYDAQTDGNLVATATYQKDKGIVFDNLRPNTTYYLQEDISPNGYVIKDSNRIKVTTKTNGEVTTIEVENEPLGSIKIEKISEWSIYGANDSKTTRFPLAGAEFTLYKDVNGDSKLQDDEKVNGIVKNSDTLGIVIFDNLEKGKYLFVETKVPDGYDETVMNDVYAVEVTEGEQNIVYTEAGKTDDAQNHGPIINTTTAGKFTFTKTDPEGKGLSGATFQLMKKNTDGDYENYLDSFTIENTDGKFESSVIETGKYQLVEITAPDNFEIMQPIEFTIEAGKVTTVTSKDANTVVNQALGKVVITKYDDRSNYSNVGNKVLEGVEFGLYQESGDLVQTVKTTGKDGKIIWTDVPAGNYYVKEVATLDGFELDTTVYPVTVESGQSTVKEYLPNTDGKIINHSNMGKIVVKKTSDANENLAGAVFKITNPNDSGFVPIIITTNEDGIAKTELLPANKEGTTYVVTEIKAPDGYTLDDKYHDIEQSVKVYPVQDETVILSEQSKNYLEFKNKKQSDIMDIDGKIIKYIDGDNNTLLTAKTVETPLLDAADTETFLLREYAQAKNDVPVRSVEVEDSLIKMYYYDANGNSVEYMPDAPYVVNTVTVHSATDKNGNKIQARVYYQTAGSDEWMTNNSLVADVSTNSQGISLEGLNALKIKVVYTNVVSKDLIAENFNATGIDVNVTFNKRPSDATVHEVRRVSNQTSVTYNYTLKDNEGNDQNAQYTKVSDIVNLYYPLKESVTPRVSLGIVSGEKDKTYKPGETIESVITVKNESTKENEIIEQPIISFDLPIGMSLNNNSYSIGDLQTRFQVIVFEHDGDTSGKALEPDEYTVTYTNDVPARVVENNQLVETTSKTKKITIDLGEDFKFKPGMKIQISYKGTSSINDTSTTLWAPAYFTSGKIIALSAENPYGNSFTVESATGSSYNTLVADSVLDEITNKPDETGDGLKYPNSNGIIKINEQNYLSIYKQVKGIYDDDYLNNNQIAKTAPGEDLDYKIVFKNGEKSDRAVSKARVVDILPFEGDSLVNRTNDNYTARVTNLDKSPILNYVDCLTPGVSYKVYYCVGESEDTKWDEWKQDARTSKTASEELPIVYGNMDDDDWTSGAHQWIEASNDIDLRLVSAIAVEFDFSNAPLEPNQSIELHVNMSAPEYSTSDLEKVSGKLMSNSALVAVKRTGLDTVNDSDIVENLEVKAEIALPKGTIGDYAFYDMNRDGLQDSNDLPVQGLNVTLHKFVTTINQNEGKVTKELDSETTLTDASGKYEFTNQDCNVLKDGKTDSSSTNPNDYVGNKYYQYQVEFAIPEDESLYKYEPTQRYAQDVDGKPQIEADSNIGNDLNKDDYCKTELFTLTATKQADGSLVGETNLTLDAGYVALGSLGDFVWFDENKNGIQDPEETGVKDVIVNLYTVTNGEVSGTPEKTTRTDENGYYLFTDLEDGSYVVEFDIRGVKPTMGGGHAERFYFTKNGGTTDSAIDSNPTITDENKNTLIARSEVIDLAYHTSDMTIDAGLTVYSAISGVAFEDRDYSDIQNYQDSDGKDVDIKLPGTIVELYRVDEEFGIENNIPTELVASTVVGEDGSYLFDYLDSGTYVVKFTYPEGYKVIEADVGDDDTLDSDVAYHIETNENRMSGYTGVINIPVNTRVDNVDGGARLYSSLGDYVFKDVNADGLQDETDTVMPDVPVYLFARQKGEEVWTSIANTITDQDGRYRFDNLKGSTYTGIEYRVIFDLPLTTKLTVPYAGDDPELDSNALNEYVPGLGFPTQTIDLAYNTVDLTWDAGIVQSKGSVGDYVWYDTNVNGIQDENGTGIEGIKVILETNLTGNIADENDWQEVGTTYTNSQGYYIFNELSEGYYRVKFEIPSKYKVTLSTQGEDSAEDSDGIYSEDGVWYYTRSFYLDQDGYDMTWDCGVYDPTDTKLTKTGSTATGDSSDINGYVVLGFSSILALGAVYFVSNKKRKAKKAEKI